MFSETAVNMFLFLHQNAIKSTLTHLWINELKEQKCTEYIDYLPLQFISVVFLKIYNMMACDEMSGTPVNIFVSLLTIESLNLFITV